MKAVAFALSVAVAVLGAIGVVTPDSLLAVGRLLITPSGLYVAGALRIVLGATLFVAAPETRFPRTLRIIGILLVVAGLTTPLVGVERVRAIVEWEASGGSVPRRLPALFALCFGLFLAYGTAPRHGTGSTDRHAGGAVRF
jgi:hypothetical protein